MRTGALYGVFISIGILLGTFNDNLFWTIAVPTVLTFLAMITVVHGEKTKQKELEDAQNRVHRVLKQQREPYVSGRYDVFSDGP
jgi:predicted MFS family arabinose efflux permease